MDTVNPQRRIDFSVAVGCVIFCLGLAIGRQVIIYVACHALFLEAIILREIVCAAFFSLTVFLAWRLIKKMQAQIGKGKNNGSILFFTNAIMAMMAGIALGLIWGIVYFAKMVAKLNFLILSVVAIAITVVPVVVFISYFSKKEG